MRKLRRRLQRAALCATALQAASLCAAQSGAARLTPQAPAWRVSLPAPIEWVAPVSASQPAVLVCDSAHRLCVLNAEDGAEWLAPHAFGPGTRFAGAGVDGVAYVHDRFSLACLGPDPLVASPAPPWKRLWQSGESFDPAGVEGDPEFLTRIVAVAPTARGAAVLRNDGLGAELARADGRVLWTFRLPRAETARLLSDRQTLAAVWSVGGRTSANSLTESSPPGAAAQLDLGLVWPLWGAAADGALLALDPAGLSRVRPGGPPRRWALDRPAPLLAAGTARLIGGTGHVFVADAAGGLQAIDVAAMQLDWRLEDPTGPAEPWTMTAGDAELAAAAAAGGVLVCDAGCGAPVLRAAIGGVRSVHVAGERVWAVAEDSAGGDGARLYGWSVVRLLGSGPVRFISPPPIVRELGGAAVVREWLWTEKTLIGVEPAALTAYSLP